MTRIKIRIEVTNDVPGADFFTVSYESSSTNALGICLAMAANAVKGDINNAEDCVEDFLCNIDEDLSKGDGR